MSAGIEHWYCRKTTRPHWTFLCPTDSGTHIDPHIVSQNHGRQNNYYERLIRANRIGFEREVLFKRCVTNCPYKTYNGSSRELQSFRLGVLKFFVEDQIQVVQQKSLNCRIIISTPYGAMSWQRGHCREQLKNPNCTFVKQKLIDECHSNCGEEGESKEQDNYFLLTLDLIVLVWVSQLTLNEIGAFFKRLHRYVIDFYSVFCLWSWTVY